MPSKAVFVLFIYVTYLYYLIFFNSLSFIFLKVYILLNARLITMQPPDHYFNSSAYTQVASTLVKIINSGIYFQPVLKQEFRVYF